MISLAHEMGPQAAPNEEPKDRGCDDQRQPTLPTHEFDVVTHYHHAKAMTLRLKCLARYAMRAAGRIGYGTIVDLRAWC